MKFSCDGNSLKSSINLLASLLPPRATLPSLSAILIESDQGFLSLTAFNLSVGLKLTIAPEQVQGNFKILVPGDVLNKLVSTMVQSQKTSVIEFEVDKSNDVLIIANQFGTVEIALLDPGSFPEIPRKFTQDKYLEIDSEMLQLGISRTTPFTGPAERFILSGVNFKSKNHQLSLTTTDGRTAAMANFEIKNNSEISTVIGEDFLSLLNKIIKVLNIDELTLPIYFDDIQVFIDLNLPSIKASIWGRVLDGAFPDVNKIIPTEFTYSIQVLKADLLNALDIIESVSANVGKPVDVDKIKVVINKILTF
jgi:DNA polymerase-3 subunit beta